MKTLRQDIEEYLIQGDPHFGEGVELLHEAGFGFVAIDLERYLMRHPVPKPARDRVCQLLAAWLDANPDDETSATDKKPNDGDLVSLLRARAKRLHKRQAFAHSQMKKASKQLDTPERETQLFAYARELMEEIAPEIKRVYDAIEAYEQHGIVPDMRQFNDEEILKRKIRNLQSSVCRFRKLLDAASTQSEQNRISLELNDRIARIETHKIHLRAIKKGRKGQTVENAPGSPR